MGLLVKKQNNYRNNSFLKTAFCIFLAVYPVLCIYTGFYKFTIGDLGLLVFTVLGLLPPPRKDRRIVPVAIFLLTTIFIFFLNLFVFRTMSSWAVSSYVFRLIKLCFYLGSAFLCGKKFFDTETFTKAVIAVGFVAALYMFFQYFAFYGLGRVYMGHLPGLEIYIEAYSQEDYVTLYKNVFRPCSIFLEPAMYVQYMIVPTTLALFSQRIRVIPKAVIVGVFSISMLMSTSAQGVAYLAIMFFVYALIGSKKKGNIVVFVFVVVMAAIVAYLLLEPFRFAVDRLLFGEKALEARIGAYQYVLDMPFEFSIVGFGYGVVPVEDYMAGAAYVLYGCGIIGFLLVANMFWSFFINARSKAARVICIIFFVMFFVTSLFYNYMLFWFATIITCLENRRHYRYRYYYDYEYEHEDDIEDK